MQNALRKLPTILARLQSRGCVLLLDFDGTLTPLKRDHNAPRLSPRMKSIVRKLSQKYPLAIISGRSLADIQKRVGIPGIAYVGCHGLEWRVGRMRYGEKMPKTVAAAFARGKKQLARLAKRYGAVVENKHYSFALHYRMLPRAQGRACASEAAEIVANINQKKTHIRTIHDQYTFDIMPSVPATKGTAALRVFRQLRKSRRDVPLYIGDSLTDEDAFKTFPRGITIRVGKNTASKARYFVERRSNVDSFLLRFAQ